MTLSRALLLAAVVTASFACGGREPIYVRDSAEIPEGHRRYAGPSGYPRVVEAGTDEECPRARDTVTVDLPREGGEASAGGEAGPEGSDATATRPPCITAAEREHQELINLARGTEGTPDDPDGTGGGGELGTQEGPTVLATFEGRASYYSDSLAGHRTASGERYDPALFTAASRDLPFDTVVRVTRTDTLDSVIVRINDRGPFGDERRILDLSRAAAARIQMLRAGVVPIRAEVIAMPSR